MNKLKKEEIIELIRKLEVGEGEEDEQDTWVFEIKKSVPFGIEIIDNIFWLDTDLSPEEIYEKCEREYKPIIL